jgi:hypothetical protein
MSLFPKIANSVMLPKTAGVPSKQSNKIFSPVEVWVGTENFHHLKIPMALTACRKGSWSRNSSFMFDACT